VTAGQFRHRLEALQATPAYGSYERVRDWVLDMQAAAEQQAASLDTARPSEYWSEELAGFEYMLDASPLIVDKLKHHSYHLTGLRVYDYRSHKQRAEMQLRNKLEALRALTSSDLFVPEPRGLGSFGFEIDGGLFTVDTLKYFEALIALEKGGVLTPLREASERQVVWEIGGGWGGFAYQFKRVCPNVTYVIVDLPATFLFSATYLMGTFPEATVMMYGQDDFENGWLDADFVFVPHTALHAVTPPRLDLVVNMVSFQEMTSGQAAAYVEHADAQGAPFLYSLNRERSAYNPQMDNVHAIIAEKFDTREIDVLPVSYVHMMESLKPKKIPKPGREKAAKPSGVRKANDYRHIIGERGTQT